jgi:tRNA pseudouridine38-40 synthase
MPGYRITLAYDGTDYVGWQRQANGVSIQGLIEDALRALDERDVTLHGAGRTDAGVHALGQVASFTLHRALPCDALVRALNARLPAAIRVLSADEAPADFHPRFSAREKTYRYRIWNGDAISPFECRYAWHVSGALDAGAMQAAAALLVGRHDFAAFQSTGSDVATTEREIVASAIVTAGPPSRTIRFGGPGAAERAPEPLIIYEVTGTGFLRHMVRAIVGTLVEVGRGRQPIEWMGRVLASRDRAIAGPTAPPEGLFLVGVTYGESLAANP